MNRKKWAALPLAAALALSLTACGEPAASPASSAPVETAEAGSLTGAGTAIFSSLTGLEFHCNMSGGVTRLTIQPDRSFSGTYRRDETGGWAGAIHGVQYRCDFTGQFTAPQQVNEYTCSVRIDRLDYAQKPGSSGGIVDGIQYYYCNAYELEDAEDILIYLPGAPTAELPEEYLSWVTGSADAVEGELPFCGMYSEARHACFRGDPVQEPSDDLAAAQAGEDPLFSQLKNLEFYFASGAGGWSTVLHIDGSGGFSGTYSDSDMGSGENGIHRIQMRCDFTGHFTQPVRVNDYTYSVRIDEIAYEKEAGTEEVIDGTQYCYTAPYGLEDAEDILIYLPGAPLGQLPQEFRGWVGYYGNTRDELPFYALNNAVHQQGFSSYDRLESIRESLEGWVEPYAAELETEIQRDASLSQGELNERSQQLYELWDGQLNELWDCLEQRLDPAEMEALTAEELEWISWKEEQIGQAGEELGACSLRLMIQPQRGAELTRDRVYELLDWLDRNGI